MVFTHSKARRHMSIISEMQEYLENLFKPLVTKNFYVLSKKKYLKDLTKNPMGKTNIEQLESSQGSH